MKTIKLLSVLLLFITNCATAQVEKAPPVQFKNLPVDSTQHQVDVTFVIEESGEARIVAIDSENPELVQYVLKKFERIQVKNDNYFVGKTMRYRFRFKLDPKDLANINSEKAAPIMPTFVPDGQEERHSYSKS